MDMFLLFTQFMNGVGSGDIRAVGIPNNNQMRQVSGPRRFWGRFPGQGLSYNLYCIYGQSVTMKKYSLYRTQEKKKEISISPTTKACTPTENSEMQSNSTKTPPKTSITQQLRTDLWRLVEVRTATELVWLTGLRIQTFPLTAKTVSSKGHTYKKKL